MEYENRVNVIRESFLMVSENFLKDGASISELKSISAETNRDKNRRSFVIHRKYRKIFIILIVPILCCLLIKLSFVDGIVKKFYETRCFVPNNYLVWEFSRPVSNCKYCRNIDSALVLPNLTKEEFKRYAYSSRPIVIKGAASHWPASKVFTLKFFNDLYERVDGAYESVEEECQFLHFKSNFNNLREVFTMSERRAMNQAGEEPWYIGWKNCHPRVLDVMTKFFATPHFLPDDAEVPYTNYVFLGYGQGAVMHLDYISRLMWQGQILGNKTWTVAPTTECDQECKGFSFTVNEGDIILLDTRIWYHSTYIENGSLSLTVTSEYG